ncbi:putative lipoprotein, partial [Bordetella bronchiseptica 00-P-2730]
MNTAFARSPRARMLAPLALAATLAGCSMAPRYERPAAPIDAAYPLEAPAIPDAAGLDDATAAADIGWRDFFRDPLLRQLIEISLGNNRDLRKAALDVEAAQA